MMAACCCPGTTTAVADEAAVRLPNYRHLHRELRNRDSFRVLLSRHHLLLHFT
jgi:hypothetical protein